MTDATEEGRSSLFCLIVRRGKKFNQGFRLRRSRKQGEKKQGWTKKQFQFLMCEHSQAREGAVFWSAQPDAQT